LRDYDGNSVTYEEYIQDYLERKAADLIRRRREQDDAEEGLHMVNVANLGDSVLEHQMEDERHEGEAERIRERRDQDDDDGNMDR
jgi:hypothetical protein